MTPEDRRALAAIAAIALAVVVLPTLAAGVAPDGAGEAVASGLAVAMLLLAFWRRPLPALTAFVLWVLFLETTELYAGGWVKRVDELAIGGFAVISLVRRRAGIRHRLWWPREAAVIVLVGLAIVSSLVNGVPARLWLPGLVLLIKGLAVFYVVLLEPIRERDLRPIAFTLIGIGPVVLFGGLVELFAPGALASIGLSPSYSARGELPSIKSIFFHPVMFAWFTSFMAIYLFTGWVQLRRPWLLLLGATMAAGTVLAARRRAMLALATAVAAGVMAQVVHEPRRWTATVRRWSMPVASLIVLALFFQSSLTALYRETVESYTGASPTPIATQEPGGTPEPGLTPEPDGTVDNSTPARLALYRGAVRIANDYFPLGAGLGRYGSWMSRLEYSSLYVEYGLSRIYGLRPQNPRFATDTFWPQIAGETGWFGVAAYLALLAALGWQLWRASARHWPTPLLAIVASAGGLVLVQSLVESLASAMYHSPARAIPTFAALAVTLAAAHTADADGNGSADG